MSDSGKQLSAGEHAMLELRLVGTSLCRLLGEWLRPRGGPTNLTDLLNECYAQLRTFTGPLAGVDEAEHATVLDVENALRALLRSAATAHTPLSLLRQNAALSPVEVDLLLLAALPDESALWSALFQTLGATMRPTVHFALNLWTETPAERVDLTQRLNQGPLARYHLLQVAPAESPFASRMLSLPERLWPSLLGIEAPETVLAGAIVEPSADSPPPPRAREALERLAARLQADGGGRVIVRGETGVGRRAAARWLAACLGRRPLELRWPTGEIKPEWSAALVRYALVRDGALLLSAQPGPNESITIDLPLPPSISALLVAPEGAELRGATFAEADIIHLSAPGAADRADLWRSALAPLGVPAPAPDELARVFRLRGDEVRLTMRHAARRMAIEQRHELTIADVAEAVRERPARRLEGLTRRRRAHASWRDLVLQPNQVNQLMEVSRRVRHRDRVFEEWGVAGHSSRQAGVTALFTGPSGTGKTLAAEVVAGELGLDLYSVDLAQTVSKYIGETEKSLERIFDAAEGTAAVLFFDEADALFGKRTETRDAHDRYANQEVSYLLTRLESFDGITILASNLRQNIDAAFLRRMDFLIEFAAPDVPARAQIWERHLRTNAPLAPDINPQWLAETFPISGAHIRNAVVAAAFGAANDGLALGVPHLLAAMRREYEKLGKPFPVRG